ncbi:MAG: type II toxin-antitoxin system VapC family toxin [Bacteroidales bacterium]|jgi:predicted nucleic acid-binding protein|nr:type II toxin-antitoxin system VapC family toxin [Bacteroidales bacterium]
MENVVVCLDTSVLIDYYRKKDKSMTFFYELTHQYSVFAVSAITEYELYIGSSKEQDEFWNIFFQKITVLPFDTSAAKQSIAIYKQLKVKNKLIDIPDILIAGTVLKNDMLFATLNRRHFERIIGLKLINKRTS